jgi:hypothetical protein
MFHPIRRLATAAAVVGIGLTAAAGLAVATVTSATAASAPPAAAHHQVWVRDCPGDKYKVAPKGFVVACADGNTYLQKITWSNWGARRAHGTGQLWANECVPNCASGKFVHEPAAVTLTRLAERHGRWDYGYITVTPSHPNHYHLRPLRESLPY